MMIDRSEFRIESIYWNGYYDELSLYRDLSSIRNQVIYMVKLYDLSYFQWLPSGNLKDLRWKKEDCRLKNNRKNTKKSNSKLDRLINYYSF